jgi:hypothetical protein
MPSVYKMMTPIFTITIPSMKHHPTMMTPAPKMMAPHGNDITSDNNNTSQA